MQFDFNLNPILFSIGFLEIRYYGLVYALGFLGLYYWLLSNRKSVGLLKRDVDGLLIYLILGVLVGARLFNFLFWEYVAFLADPLVFFKLWLGGMSFHGAFVGAFVGGYLFSKKKDLDFLKLLDLVTLPVAIGLMFGRVANFVNGELLGVIAQDFMCINYSFEQGCRHAYTLYEAVFSGALGFLMFYVSSLKVLKKGALFWIFVLVYNGGRFLLEFFRDDAVFLVGLSITQFLCIAFFILAGVFLLKTYIKQ